MAAARRRDQIEAALVAALVAVLVHNVVDFGLETLGVLLPFAAILGTVLGRTRDVPERALSPRSGIGIWAVALGGILIGGASVAAPTRGDFDRIGGNAPAGTAKREMALRAQAAHPVDYFYVLAQAAAEPIAPDAGGRSPRLHALNHALLLCPHCPAVHAAVAGTLWALGKRARPWRNGKPRSRRGRWFSIPSCRARGRQGRDPKEIAVIAGEMPERLFGRRHSCYRGHAAAARALLPLAKRRRRPPEQVLLIEGGARHRRGRDRRGLEISRCCEEAFAAEPACLSPARRGQSSGRAGRRSTSGPGHRYRHESARSLALAQPPRVIMSQRKWFLAKDALEALEIGLARGRTADDRGLISRPRVTIPRCANTGRPARSTTWC